MILTIDPEFQALIPPLTPDKLAGLEAELVADGGPREPITVWQHEGRNVIVDGHNRFALCQKHGLPYQVAIKTFFDRGAAKDWMLANQLNRRNITDEQVCMLSAIAGRPPPGVLAATANAFLARDLVGTQYPEKVLSGFFSLRQAHNRWKKDTMPPKPKLAVAPKPVTAWDLDKVDDLKGSCFGAAARAIAMEHGDREPPVFKVNGQGGSTDIGSRVHITTAATNATLLDVFLKAVSKHGDLERVCDALSINMGDAERLLDEAKRMGHLFQFGRVSINAPPTPKGVGETIIIPDLHAPYHNARDWEVCLAAIEARQPQRVGFIGDGWDCYACSKFDKSPERSTRALDELELFGAEMKRLRKVLAPGCEVFYCQGNHELRLDSLVLKNPCLHGLISAKDQILKYLPGAEWIGYRDFKRIGNVLYSHDLDFAGVYAGRHTLVAANTNVVFGHTHMGSVTLDGSIDGERRFSLNVGWLGDLSKIDYMHKAKKTRYWTSGLGHVYECPDTGLLWPSFVPIMRGRCYVAGQRISI